MAKNLHQQPRRITARSRSEVQSLFTTLYAGLHANHITDRIMQTLIQSDEEIDRWCLVSWHVGQKSGKAAPRRLGLKKRTQFASKRGFVDERRIFGRGL